MQSFGSFGKAPWYYVICVGTRHTDPEVLIALNSSDQSGILLYYIVNNAASSQQLQIIITITCK